MSVIRCSVRNLVEFTWHGEDILPSGSIADRLDGQLGHKARQAFLGSEWQAEVPLSFDYSDSEELSIHFSGRADALFQADIPIIEEIKLGHGTAEELQLYTPHLLQAVCYAYFLSLRDHLSTVQIRVAYVLCSGELIRAFDRVLSAKECETVFQELLQPYLQRLRQLQKHLSERNAALSMLSFPYPQWRNGQREMAAQVYLAIKRKKRLFASLPTGCGKSAATVFPALKALGEGLTGKIYYLTARTTQRQGPLDALNRIRKQSVHLWCLVLDSKEKQCPEHTVCHPDWCPRAKGHFLRDHQAINELLLLENWTPDIIRSVADRYLLCPFELSLSLSELADFTVFDYNYALHPGIHIHRIFDRPGDNTLLIDEAHHLLDRTRDMLSGTIDAGRIRRLRTVVGKHAGRKHPLYIAMSEVIHEACNQASSGNDRILSESFRNSIEILWNAFRDAMPEHFPWDEAGERTVDVISELYAVNFALNRPSEEYEVIRQGSDKNPSYTLYAIKISPWLKECTAKSAGTVCFSATLEPLNDMKKMLGGDEDDACFAMSSPFPPEHLLVLKENINTRFRSRASGIALIVERILLLQKSHPGHYIVFFSSFAYMNMAAGFLNDNPAIQVQQPKMTDKERMAFLDSYTPDHPPVTSLCVMGGLFSEGIDLPGNALDGVMIVGTGLPQVNVFTECIRQGYDCSGENGFHYVYRIPGMHKVIQAAGRVIRTENDIGIVYLLDDRYSEPAYRRLLPTYWNIRQDNPEKTLREFWQSHCK